MTVKELKKAKLPDAPGVYFFLGPKKEILYIGKATSLSGRVKSYFSDDLIVTRGPLLVDMVTKAHSVKYETTDSVLEALILEANLIKKHQPHYNTESKDDKSFNYVLITKEEYPRVVVMRGKDLAENSPKAFARGGSSLGGKSLKFKATFGPFPHGQQFKEALKLIRKIFPFRTTCLPAQPGEPHQGKPCFDAQIGLCPGVCTGEITKEEYEKIIQQLRFFFEGKKKKLIKTLEREMKMYAKAEEFENAEKIKKRLFALTHIQDVALIRYEFRSPRSRSFRIEAYDIAHMSGTHTVGVMTVITAGEADKSQYRKFRIRSKTGGSDTDALKEVIARRFDHPEWVYPRLIIVDGGKAQKNAAERLLKTFGVEIPVVAVTKDEKHRPMKMLGERTLIATHGPAILLANAEAHRFAIKYFREKQRGELL